VKALIIVDVEHFGVGIVNLTVWRLISVAGAIYYDFVSRWHFGDQPVAVGSSFRAPFCLVNRDSQSIRSK
jgi:hypothetical protein